MIKKYRVFLSYPDQEMVEVAATTEEWAQKIAVSILRNREPYFRVDCVEEITD